MALGEDPNITINFAWTYKGREPNISDLNTIIDPGPGRQKSLSKERRCYWMIHKDSGQLFKSLFKAYILLTEHSCLLRKPHLFRL